MSTFTQQHPQHAREARFGAAIGVFWFLLTAVLAMTASLLVLGGAEIVEATGVRVALVIGLVAFALHSAGQYRHRHEPPTDERLLRARERRGF